METWVKVTHILLLLVNIVVFFYATIDMYVDIHIMKLPMSWYTMWLYFGGGIGIAGYWEALLRGESKWWIKVSFMCYACCIF